MKYIVVIVALIFALVIIGGMFSALNTGRSYWKPGFVERADNPALYWFSIVTYGILAVACLLMALFVSLFR
jgi:fumarate reductase subunit C